MKRVGLATCFLDNYGACLQAYALSRVIGELGNECTILNYTEPEGYYGHGMVDRLKNTGVYNAIRCCLSSGYRTSYKFGKIRRKSFERFRKRFLPISREEYPSCEALRACISQYDAFVCGSDQVWNPTFYGECNKAYYLSFVPETMKKIAYAPSIGLSDLPEEYAAEFHRYLQSFDAISVRENNAVELVRTYADREARWVLDPTMLLSGKEWSEITVPRSHRKPYIFCYLFGNQVYYKDAIERLRRETGYDVVIIPFSERDLAKEYHKVYRAGPAEFISLIKHAEFVLTDSFHATVFSILFGRSFYTLLRNVDGEVTSMNSRIYSLLSMVGKEDRCVSREHVLDYPISSIEDYEAVHERLSVIRKESLDFLKQALED